MWHSSIKSTYFRSWREIKIRSSHFKASYLEQRDANYVNLTPISFFRRAVRLFPNKSCYQHGSVGRTWKEVNLRVRQLRSALQEAGAGSGDVVSIIAPNSPSIFEAHFAVPASGAVLHSMNTRSDAHVIAFQMMHAKTKVLIVDSDHREVVQEAFKMIDSPAAELPVIVEVRDSENTHIKNLSDPQRSSTGATSHIYHQHERLTTYEEFLASGGGSVGVDGPLEGPIGEWDAISLNYTSGTTGNPKGVVCHHRGAYLNALANVVEWSMPQHARYLWIVPLFHCNGWCFAWTMAAIAGTSYFVREMRAPALFDIIQRYKVQYLAGAPITMHIMLNHPEKFKFDHEVKFWAGGAPPPPALIKRFKNEIGITCETVYGLTEVYGPVTRFKPDADWSAGTGTNVAEGLSVSDTQGAEREREEREDALLDRCTYQVGDSTLEDVRVMDPVTMTEVPVDGRTLGEVMIRGNVVMKGYLGNESTTEEVFRGGWFHTGDLAVSHPNGRFELKDRSKDIIISGGENISSIEVENTLISHPAVGEVAVVAMPHEFWGEVPCAFVTRRPGVPAAVAAALTEQELILYARTHMPHYAAPKAVRFVESLPKTSTGKVQKHELRKLLATSQQQKQQ